MIKKLVFCNYIFLLGIICFCAAQDKTYNFEDLGQPVRSPLAIKFVTNDEVTGPIAWGGMTDAEKNVLVGVGIKDGKLTQVDFTEYGKSNSLLLFKKSERYIYLFAGKKGRFFKYDVRLNELQTIGPESNALYWMGSSYTIAPDGSIYVGTYPRAAVSVLNPKTEEVKIIDRVSSTKGSEYVINPASDKDGIIYFPTGMQHGELWAYNPNKEQKKQILPQKLMTYGAPQIWKADDGNVYGRKGNTTFLCTEEGIVEADIPERMSEILDNGYGNIRALYLNTDGNLVVENQKSRERSIVESSFEPSAHEVFSIGDVHNNILYGSGMKPGHIFTYNLNTNEINDLGNMTRGRIQTYDMLAHENQLFMSSYTGGFIDVFTLTNNGLPTNRKAVAHLHGIAKQERLLQLVLGADGYIYSPTMPIKGFLGGALVRVDPKTLKTKVFENIVHNQSLMSVTSIKETGELFLTSSVQGGTSSKPTEKEAVVVLWDPISEQVTYKESPVKGARSYGKTVLGNNGLVYGSAADTIFVFDPVKRKVLTKIQIKGSSDTKARVILSETLAKDGLVYGVDNRNGQLFSIDTSTNTLIILSEHPSLVNARFAEVKEDGYLYYPNHSRLMRVRVYD